MSVIERDTAGFEAEHRDYRESFRTFLEREVVKAQADWRTAREIPRPLLTTAGEYGFLGARVPEEHGGAGIDDPRFGAVIGEEAMLVGAPALALVLSLHNDVAVPALLRGGEAAAPYLAGAASGEQIVAVVNRAGGTDGTVAATFADLLLIVDEDGLSVLPRGQTTITPTTEPVGLDAAGLGAVSLDGAAGTPIAGDVQELLIDQALALAVTALAGARYALNMTIAYVTDRKAFGQPLSAFQNTRRTLAQIAAEIEIATAHVDAVLARRLAGSLGLESVLAAKLFCADLYGRTVDAGVQFHGGYGYIMEYEIAHAYADARFWRLHEPDNERLKDTIANSLFA